MEASFSWVAPAATLCGRPHCRHRGRSGNRPKNFSISNTDLKARPGPTITPLRLMGAILFAQRIADDEEESEEYVAVEENEEDKTVEDARAEIRIVLNAHEELKRLLPMEGN